MRDNKVGENLGFEVSGLTRAEIMELEGIVSRTFKSTSPTSGTKFHVLDPITATVMITTSALAVFAIFVAKNRRKGRLVVRKQDALGNKLELELDLSEEKSDAGVLTTLQGFLGTNRPLS